MAIAPLPAREYGIVFDGINSKTKGVYITDGAFYSAPERDVELIEIPGRNGSFVLDKGRFKNITVTYKAVLHADTAIDFINGMADVRAWLCSKTGYVRLSDDFNPGQYRMAVCAAGVEVSNINPKTGEFDITFECMPQRFLTAGEIKQTIAASGDTIENPTLFNARPLLEVSGYGHIGINDDDIRIRDDQLGTVIVLQAYQADLGEGLRKSFTVRPDYSRVNPGDPITLTGGGWAGVTLPGVFESLIDFTQTGTMFQNGYGGKYNAYFQFSPAFTYTYGTAVSESASFTVYYRTANDTLKSGKIRITVAIGTDGEITITLESYTDTPLKPSSLMYCEGFYARLYNITAKSSQSALGNPLYIDLDLGEAYKEVNGKYVSVNYGVAIGSELPELIPGDNTITYDNTIRSLKITPRWWTI